jgi:N-acetylglucosaminyldiphosphoundecaprenol N-acetyl-beta-D-mannosaminyltransferase
LKTSIEKLSTRDERVSVVSLNVNVCDEDSISERVAELVGGGSGAYVCFSTVHMVMEAFDHPDYAEKVNAADMVVPDGMPLVWMQRLQGRKDAARTRANDMMVRLLAEAASRDWPVGFYGGSERVIQEIREKAIERFPALRIVYAYSPPYRPLTPDEDAAVTREINEAAPKLLCVGLGCPKQEIWMSAKKEQLNCVMFGVGASFDFFAGNVKESPAWLGNIGLEWLFRLYQEPRRLWYRYLVLNPRFIIQAGRQLIFRR